MATYNLELPIPDAAIPDIKAAFGGATNAETIEIVQALLLAHLREQTNTRRLAQHRAANVVAYTASEGIERDRLEVIWEEEP